MPHSLKKRRDAREAEGARLEIVYPANNGIEGSNPSLSATNHVGFVAVVHPTWCTAPWVINHVGCMAALYPAWYRAPV